MASYSTNPYNNFQAANSKEYISLDKGAKQDFRPETRFDILPGNSDLFCAEIKKCATQFGYGALLNVPTGRDVDPSDSNIITYKDQINMTKTWNKMTDDIIAKNANEVWGSCDWTASVTKQVDELSAARGEVTATNLTKKRKEEGHGTLEVHCSCLSSYGNANSQRPGIYQNPRESVPVDRSPFR